LRESEHLGISVKREAPRGETQESIAAHFQMCRRTFTIHRAKNAAVAAAWESGRATISEKETAALVAAETERMISAAPLPPIAPFIDEWTSEQLHRVPRLAARGDPQGAIANHFSLSADAFKRQLAADAGENALRLAWESGYFDFERELTGNLRRLAAGHGREALAANVFLAKSRFGWRDSADPPSINNAISFILPGSMSPELDFGQF
jgi:hypothetical protein